MSCWHIWLTSSLAATKNHLFRSLRFSCKSCLSNRLLKPIVTCYTIVRQQLVVSGWIDGFVQCYVNFAFSVFSCSTLTCLYCKCNNKCPVILRKYFVFLEKEKRHCCIFSLDSTSEISPGRGPVLTSHTLFFWSSWVLTEFSTQTFTKSNQDGPQLEQTVVSWLCHRGAWF